MSYTDDWLDSLFSSQGGATPGIPTLMDDDPVTEAVQDNGGFDPRTLAAAPVQASVGKLSDMPLDTDNAANAPAFTGPDLNSVSKSLSPDDPIAATANDTAAPAGTSAINQTLDAKRDQMLQSMDTDFNAGAGAQQTTGELIREQTNKKEMTGEAQLVTLAPGTRLEIVGVGTAEVRGAPDI